MIIRITKDQKNYEDIKKNVYNQTLKGYRNIVRRSYDKAELVFVPRENRLALMIDELLAPRQINIKSLDEKRNDALFDEYMGSAKKAKKNRKSNKKVL